MKHSARLNSNRIIALSFILLVVLLFLSVTANVILSVTNYKLQGDRQVVAVPMLFKAPFAVSENSMDAGYLEQMALSFVALRLNVTPETVDSSHQFLLAMVKPASQKSLKLALVKEANQIKKNDVNAAFFKTGIRVYPAEGRVDIRGELKTWFGDGKPDSVLKHYSLYIDRSEGVTWLAKFVEVSDEKK
ncbi:type IV conjugative transfer system protein TraE [Serratia liquefaciens]|uniref:type IV conjugative transfer system protein TraE n=1 Tax=Serratia liquefaciens TaxID=614 RepID=UPI0022B9F284|nr:type IV conjugative transfer system protein TraE [Serratia liquefaciens]